MRKEISADIQYLYHQVTHHSTNEPSMSMVLHFVRTSPWHSVEQLLHEQFYSIPKGE